MSVSFVQVVGVSTVVSGTVTAALRFVTNRWQFDYQLRKRHHQEQRQMLRELRSRYLGRLLEAALDWDRRAAQLYDGHFDDLCPPPDERLDHKQYYFQSVIFRFLNLMATARQFEGEAFYMDPEIAEERDFDLLRYAKGFLWVAIHAEITPNDGVPGIDHFRSDAFRPLLDLCFSEAGPLPQTRTKQNELVFDRQRCMAVLSHGDELGYGEEVDEVMGFFTNLRPDEYDDRGRSRRQRRRWDRVVALHLLVLAFIDQCGYQWDAEDVDSRIAAAVAMLLHPDALLQELGVWLPRLGLDHGSMTKVSTALRTAAEGKQNETDAQRAARVMGLIEAKRATGVSREADAPETYLSLHSADQVTA